jgi:hypothetical protein
VSLNLPPARRRGNRLSPVDVTALTPRKRDRPEIREYSHAEAVMAGKTKRLAKTVVALAATALTQKAIEQALKSRPMRKKAARLQKAVSERARATGKVAAKKVKRLVKAAR